MSYKIEVVKNSEIIRVTYVGTLTLDQRISAVHELCCDFNIFSRFRLLIDVRNIQQEMTVVEQEVFGNFIASKEEFNHASVAVLDNIEHPADQIAGRVAAKLGYRMQQFDREEKALAWLNN